MLRMTSSPWSMHLVDGDVNYSMRNTGEANLGLTSGVQLIHVFYLLFKESVTFSAV